MAYALVDDLDPSGPLDHEHPLVVARRRGQVDRRLEGSVGNELDGGRCRRRQQRKREPSHGAGESSGSPHSQRNHRTAR